MKRNVIRVRDTHHVKKTKLSHLITIPKIEDEGYLCFAEENNHIPFPIKRFYYISNVMKGVERGFHAHHQTLQVLFCIKGEVTIVLDNGHKREKFVMKESNKGIFLDKMMWHEMNNFKKDTILLVIASEIYEESDYIRDYQEFNKIAQQVMPQSQFGDVFKSTVANIAQTFNRFKETFTPTRKSIR